MNFDGLFKDLNNGSNDHYSEEQIEEARRLQKKNGMTFMDCLRIVAPQVKNTTTSASAARTIVSGTASVNKAMAESVKTSAPSVGDVSSLIKDLNTNIKNDASINVEPKVAEEVKNTDPATALNSFKGITEKINETVYGQEEFVKKLVISFKRPFVTERDDNDALNSILILGPSNTGRHYSLSVLLKELHERGVLSSEEICSMDLSLYQDAASENLFIQDLYSNLKSASPIVLFENFESCHITHLTKLADLAMTGEMRLSERYVMKQGQLVSVANSLSGDTIGTLDAKGKYLVFISSNKLDKVAGIMGAPFVNAIGDICETSKLSDEAIEKIAGRLEDELKAKAQKQLGFKTSLDAECHAYALSQTSKNRGLKGVEAFYTNALKAMSELRLERDDLESDEVELGVENGEVVIRIADETIELNSFLPDGFSGELDSINEELDRIVGLTEVKEYIHGLREYYGVQKKRAEEGLKAGELNKHMIFTGNPGTGKTTIARIVSKYLKAIGVLNGGQLIEVSRADLVGRYVGHTAPLVNQVIKSALGGVLFIDEAYSLYRGSDDNFGLEAIDTLVKGIEDHRDDLVVILAGYSKEMEDFLESNSGLKSRFPNIIDFPDYNADELLKIARITASSKGYSISEEADDKLLSFFDHVQHTNAREAGNGRLVRNKVEEAILNQSRRLVAEPDADLSLLTLGDFELDF